jgi:hypothetical protein
VTQSKALVRFLTTAGAAILAIALFAPLAQAVEEPQTGFTQFRGCPRPEEKVMYFCVHSEVTGGHLQTGKKDVPIKHPITLIGGAEADLTGFFNNSEGGLAKVKQEVPGGVIGITGLEWLTNFLTGDALKLYAVAELAGTPSNFTFSTVTLPLKVHLENTTGVLGKNCYIGSTTKPMTLNLITGTTNPPPPNEPITGEGFTFSEENEIAYLKKGVFVDNEFAAPAASGCVLTLLGFIPISLDSLVNFQAGLPSAAGTNEAIQNLDIEIALQESVY